MVNALRRTHSFGSINTVAVDARSYYLRYFYDLIEEAIFTESSSWLGARIPDSITLGIRYNSSEDFDMRSDRQKRFICEYVVEALGNDGFDSKWVQKHGNYGIKVSWEQPMSNNNPLK